MSIFAILLALIVAGVLLWVVNQLIPMDGTIKRIFNIVVIVVLIVWLLKVFGAWTYLMSIHV